MNPQTLHSKDNREIKALVALLDDPDEVVNSTVNERLEEYGVTAIPHLEEEWEHTDDSEMQERILLLIHRLQYHDLLNDLREWRNNPYHDLLFGALLIGKYQYPDSQATPVIQQLERIKRSIWLELNSFLTPLEKMNVFSKMLHLGFGLKGTELNYQHPDDFLLQKTLETKRGNLFSNAVLYMILAELLDMPLRVVNIPRQFLLAYYSADPQQSQAPRKAITFFVDPVSGQVFSHDHIDGYFKKINVPIVKSYFRPLSNQEILQQLTEQLSRCFDAEQWQYKRDELMNIARLLND